MNFILLRVKSFFHSDGQMSLKIGQYSYPFSFTLPEKIPSSYEGSHGHVRYFLKAQMIRHWRSNQITSLGFSVTNPLDLNLIPLAKVYSYVITFIILSFY